MTMASKVAEDNCNAETEEGTADLQKKLLRWVSFSEITSVHVFDRDDEFETPPDPKLSYDYSELEQSDEGLGFHCDSTDDEDSKEYSRNEDEDDKDGEFDARRSFLRPIESSSPGSTIGSATSNDEDNFFGPISANFIKPGRLSDSAASDENHDITMDSAAFSMHFRSLARSDSGGDLKSPAGIRCSFEEKTPTQNTIPINLGSSMVLTAAKKPIAISFTSVDKRSSDAKQLISPSIDQLSLPVICVLKDVLVNLWGLQKYEMLCSEIQSQKSFDNLSSLQHKRIAEMKLSLLKIVHELAKLQLMRVKRKRLLKRVQLLSSGIQESKMLKLKFLPHLAVPCAGDAHVNDSHLQSLVNFKGIQEEEVAGDKVTALRQLMDASERKKMFCMLFGQLWEVDKLESINVHHNFILNYLGFIIQRFTINLGPVSSIKFPSMDVCSAFAFVLNTNPTRKYVSPRSLNQETQYTTIFVKAYLPHRQLVLLPITSSVLGNLLDVVEEVRVAHVEFRNLTHTTFCSPSAEQLELLLCFSDFKSGRKVALTLDMSCLKWTVYPSEIIPSQLEGPADVSQASMPEPLSSEIRAAVQSHTVGYLRIIDLCRCVSQVFQAWDG